MIKVDVVSDNTGYKSIKFTGHALFDEYGKDIVCAAVSVLALNTFNSIELFCEDNFKSYEDPEKGILAIEFVDDLSDGAKLLMDSLMLGLTDISEQYGSTYLVIRKRQEV
ncbi:MAG: ribosomal-processing cysteine protease Prp [Catonella sp.]|jgi:hypothetical protein|nr:ribosomal-processing cysteine protease Prp [Catonella sp.]MDY6357593.1 ribosomal-processing cysteine protease Prp [Catonella sp.]